MPRYKYTARDNKGKTITGVMNVADDNELHTRLRDDGKFLIESKEVGAKQFVSPLKTQQVTEFCRQISTLLGAGVSLVRSLSIIAESESIKPKERKVYLSTLKLVRQGIALSDAMEMQNGAFPGLLINMVRSAEAGGNMDATFLRMAEHYDKEFRLAQKVKSAMTYPKILSVLIVLVVCIIMTYILPQFEDMFAMMDDLPATTKLLQAISNGLREHWLIIIIVLGILYVLIRVLLMIPIITYYKDKAVLYMPVMGKLQRVIFTARFSRTLCSLYTSGIPMVTCLQIGRTTIGNAYIERQFDAVISYVKSGGNLSEALGRVDGFVNKLPSNIKVGEETGSLDTMLIALANSLDYESEMAIERMVSYLEPAMIVVMAVVVGFIIISVIQPLYGSYDSIG
jgi:type IV pilus assembly protein PilC